MKQGDFSTLAKDYVNRAGYSLEVLGLLKKHVGAEERSDFRVADVGAGTGKLTENLTELRLMIHAVEPNDAMRAEGERVTAGHKVTWSKGSGENTGLETQSMNWILMGSSFHWVDKNQALPEFYRILKPGGFFTAVWNPRDIERSPLHLRIEERIYEIVPNLKRVSSGSGKYTETLYRDIVSTGHFKSPIFVEAQHEVAMTPERYLGAWRSVNDIQAQAGPDGFQRIMTAISEEISGLREVVVPYKTRAWTAERIN